MRVLITGGSSALAATIGAVLRRSGHDVLLTDRVPHSGSVLCLLEADEVTSSQGGALHQNAVDYPCATMGWAGL